MNIKNLFRVMLLLLATLGFQGCSDSDNDTTSSASGIVVTRLGSEIEHVSFTIESGNVIIGILSGGDWTAKLSDESWVTISNHAGYGDANNPSYVRVSVARNETGSGRQVDLVISSGSITKVIPISQGITDVEEGDPFESGFSFVRNINRGYNLGNTLDANADTPSDWFKPETVYDWETVWGQPVTTQGIINDIASKGFNVIRVPVTWFPHMDAEGNVDEAWMNRVQEVVDYVINAGCYCILNVQHDTGARDEGRKDMQGWLYADLEAYPQISARYKVLWQQIAERFKDYDDKLLFEAFNEILNAQQAWNVNMSKTDYKAVNMLEQDFVDVVRATGGNNEYRNLICNPMGADNKQEPIDAFTGPVDNYHANHIIVSVHSYDPYNFCNDAKQYNKNVFDESCASELDALFARVDKRFRQELGLPYFFGEFGAIDGNKKMEERVKYTGKIVELFKQYNTSGLWWMGLYDRKKGEWYEEEIVDALFQ